MDIYKYAISNNLLRQSYWYEPADEPFFPVTVGQLIDWAADKWKDDEAFVCVRDDVRLTFRDVKQRTNEVAAGLLELGLNPGDIIALWGSTSSVLYVTALAAMKAGIILAGIGRKNNISELKHRLFKTNATALLVIELNDDEKSYCSMLHEAIPELLESEPGKLQSNQFPNLKTIITLSSTPCRGTFSYDEMLSMKTSGSIERVHRLQNIIQPDDGLIIYFTSGSTGLPKCVPHTHHSVINSIYKNITQYGLNQKEQRIFSTLQIYEGPAMRLLTLRTFIFGCTAVFVNSNVDVNYVVNILENERCTGIANTFTRLVDIIGHVKKHKINMSYPENVFIVGSLVTETLASEILKTLPVKRLYVGYGLTECGRIGYSKITSAVENISVYRVIKNIEVKIVDEEGKMVPIGQPGELWVRGHNVMKEYLNDHEKTVESITPERWLKTGDVFILEEPGCIRYFSRIKEMIKKSGNTIYPKEIENVLSTHPLVKEVHAFGVPDYRVGEELCVFILPNSEKLKEEDVKNYCKGKVLDFKIPRYVRFVNGFPKVMKGKVSKMKLFEMFKNDEEYVQQEKNNRI